MGGELLAATRATSQSSDHYRIFPLFACALLVLVACGTIAEDDGRAAVSSNDEALTAVAAQVSCKGKQPCNDGLACTRDDRCADGVCRGTPYSCNDNNVCTADLCDSRGGCNFVPISGSCNDGNPCTFNDSCVNGACAGTPYTCDDGNSCTADSCDGAGGCTHTPLSGTSCNDGNACTTNDTCVAGVCRGIVPAEICGNGIDDDCDGLIDDADPRLCPWAEGPHPDECVSELQRCADHLGGQRYQ
jgi:hypothetical protein